jgi:hypothetical protein
MNETDWALVVGVQFYPALGDLDGPKNDVEAFKAWLLDPQGGDMNPEHILTVTSPDGPPQNEDDAEPTVEKVLKAAKKIKNQATFDAQSNRNYVGRRLYLYFAGHGFSARADRTALLMANASDEEVGPNFHWLADANADWFYKAGYFDEILLFMDCCREEYDQPVVDVWKPESYPNFRDVRRFYAYATGWSLLSREIELTGGIKRGVFTCALIEGLRSRGNVPKTNRVTTRSMRDYLIASVKVDSTNALKESDFIVDDFEIVRLPNAPGTYPVRIKLPAGAANCQVEVQNGDFETIFSTTANAGEVWEVALGKGLYQVVIPGLLPEGKPFRVTGAGGIDVEL